MRLEAADCKDFAERGKRVVVTLNGLPVKHVTMADEEAGLLERVLTNAKGNFVIAEDREDVVRCIERGVVKIQIVSTH